MSGIANGWCIIVGAGDFDEKVLLKQADDLVVAADGGVEHLKKCGVTPNVVIGDFDSLGYTPEQENVVKLPAEKDITDTAAAIQVGLDRGYKKFKIYGGTGGRSDHTFANIQNMVSLIRNGFYAEIISDKQIYTAVCNNKTEFEESYSGYISVFSYSDISTGVSIRNLKYCLEDAVLTNENPLGVSNEFVGKKAEVEVKEGILLIIYDRKSGL